MGIFDKFKSGFKKSASAFTSGLRDIVIKKEIDDKTLDKIEEYLIQSDVGIIAAAAAIIPTSDWIRYSSILSKVLSSISFFITISLKPDVKADALFLNPDLNLSKIPIKY